MAETNFFSTDWLKTMSEFQQKAMSSWLDSSRQAFSGAPTSEAAIGMWRESMDQWRKFMLPNMMSNMMPNQFAMPGQDYLKGMMSFSENYTKFVDIFFKGFGNLQDLQGAGGQWKESVEKTVEQLKEVFQIPFAGKAFSEGMMGFWGQNLNAWSQVANSALQLPENPFQSMLGQDFFKGGQVGREQLEKILAAPAVGPNPEVQAKYKTWALLALRYQTAFEGNMTHMSKVGPAALDKLKTKLLAMGEKGEKIDTLYGLFSLLVECGDAAFGEMTNSPEYRKANSEMVHSMMRLKQHQQEMLDDQLTSMGMPSRREVNTTHRRVIELKRTVRNLAEDLGAGAGVGQELSAMRDEIAALKKEVEELKGGAKRAATARKPQAKEG